MSKRSDSDEPLPLWREAIPDREPWRRGRVAIILISGLFLIAQAASTFAALFEGETNAFFFQVLIGWFVCVFLFLMWIGQNWARWIAAPLIGFLALREFVWGLREGDGLTIVYGIGLGIIFAYLALAPAVYAFARRQRESASLWQSLLTGVVFLLVLASIGFGYVGFFVYKKRLENEGTRFAFTTLHRVFIDHDADYLSAHALEQRRLSSARGFLDRVEQLGSVKLGGPIGARFSTSMRDEELEIRGLFRERLLCENGNVWVRLEILRKHNEWRIVHIAWDY